MRDPRVRIASVAVAAACLLVALAPLARAQSRAAQVECRKTETQAECHARLKCRANEELEDCQRRLLDCRAGEDLAECKRRAGAQARERDGRRDDADRRDRDRDDADRGRRGRDDADQGRRDRRGRDADRGRRDRRGRDADARSRGRRGDRDGDGRRRGGDGARGFQANKTFGLGLELGEPSGLTGKYFFSDNGAFDFGIGWIYRHYYYGDGMHLYADLLFHPVSLVSADAFELPLYIGGGLRYWSFRYCYMQFCDERGAALGLRIPIGIAFDFNDAPLDIFLQVVPVIDFVHGDYYDRYRDRTHVGVDLSVGFRFWFN
jgi:hypothetical protein